MATLPLNDVVSVNVTVSPTTTILSGFNVGCIIGKSTIISAVTRAKEYASTNEMLSDGWAGTEAEFVAAQKYFGQSAKPAKVVIGRWDGTGAETAVQAFTAVRGANSTWYAGMVVGATKTEILAIAAYAETATPYTTQFFTTADADVPLGTAGNVFLSLQALGYKRTIGMYSTVTNAVSAIMGYAMGANTNLPNSAYTLKFKSLAGVATEALTIVQVSAIENANGNVYVNRGSVYNIFEQGVMSDGSFFDEIINLDMLANDLQIEIMRTLINSAKVPQTQSGVDTLVSACVRACETSRTKGFVATGIWRGGNVLTFKNGTMLQNGYIVLVDSLITQSDVDRAARKAPTIYVLVKLAGAIHSVLVNVTVNR